MKKFKQKRKWWYKGIKALTRGRYKEPKFIYLGEKVTKNAIILSNHEGTDAPMSLENYADFPIRFWGSAEMNSGLKRLYKYQTEVYYYQKKGWSLFAARAFCLIASPITNLFYKGLNLISTYSDTNFRKTLRESIEANKAGDNIVIFPEKSDEGYKAELDGFYAGFVVLAEVLLRRGIDVQIYTAYLKKADRCYIFDEPIYYSKLKEISTDKDELAQILVERCNALGKMDFSEDSTPLSIPAEEITDERGEIVPFPQKEDTEELKKSQSA